MFKFLYSLFWGTDEEEALSLEESYKILQLPAVKKKEEEVIEPLEHECVFDDNYTVLGKKGEITNVENDQFTIDNLYTFQSDSVYFRKGSKVSFNLFLEPNGHKVTNVHLIENDWTAEEETTSKWCLRTLICNVEDRYQRKLFVKPHDIEINLDEVASDFVPKIGDWLQLDAKCEIDENVVDMGGKIYEILKISALRPHIRECTVTSWDAQLCEGTLDNSIYFNKESLSGAYDPLRNDKVTAEVIESDQKRCTFRAITVIPNFIKSNSNLKNVLDKVVEIEDELKVKGVYLNKLQCLKFSYLKETRTYKFIICNKLEEAVTVNCVNFPRPSSQCKVLINYENVLIPSKGSLEVSYECTSANMGKSKEYLLVSTDKGDLSCWLDIYVQPSSSTPHGQYKPNRNNYTYRDKKNVIRGQNVYSAPRFKARRMPDYTLSKRYLDLITKHGNSLKNLKELKREMCQMKPCLLEELSFSNYLDKLHSLLYIEEVQNIMDMSQYDQELTVFVRCGEFLVWQIDNLSEKRPSILVGDKVFAHDPYKNTDVTWEGFVHKTGAKHVYLKFSPVFHQSYDSEDYSTHVEATRTTIKRLHFAVDMAVKNLGVDLLFPSRLQLKDPQVSFEIPKVTKKNQDNLAQNPDTNAPGSRMETLKKIMEYNKKSPEEKEEYKNQILTQSSNDSNTSDDDSSSRKNALRRKEALQRLMEYNKKSPEEKENYKNQVLNRVSSERNSSEDDSDAKSQSSVTSEDTNKTSLKKDVLKLQWYNDKLNYYQREAVKNILLGEARPLPYVIFGPPGTGKTVTLVECILQILRLIPSSRILVTAPSNSAADLLALRLIESKVLKPGDLVRYISNKYVPNVPPELVPYATTGNMSREGTNTQAPQVLENGMVLGATSKVLGRHRITVSTCSSAGSLYMMDFSKDHFSHILVDEAGQAMEPEVLIPLVFLNPSSGQAILAGDPLQLGPVITSPLAKEFGLQTSYLERVLDRFPYARDTVGFPSTNGYDPKLITKLLYNYRSMPSLLKLTSSLFYDDDLIPVLSEDKGDSEEVKLLEKLGSVLGRNEKTGKIPNIIFHGIVGQNLQTPDSPSWFNPSEVGQVLFYVNALYKAGLKCEDIGIISPYVKQVKEIRSILSEAEFEVPKIGSVEEFQGQEFNVVILSTVRSSEEYISFDMKHSLGFISVPRRLNVALSRARILLIIIGNPNLLYEDPYWRTVLNYAVENGSFVGCPVRLRN
ncbi:probable RNA helicase armi [Coccinella septempunctata]|uniref:probable RNA helicase armi n=1 Tax=Coccinella septempunctata TaxID=41139 RepID=UPI001D086071|nr:probable RNA helicase armi [Coccinella septempunctata]